MISTRYALAVSALFCLAFVPTIVHTYIGIQHNDGLHVASIARALDGYLSEPTNRRQDFGLDTFASQDWAERTYTTSNGTSVTLFAARSYDVKALYHHPEIAILRGTDLEDRGMEQLPGEPRIPVRVLANRSGQGLAAYALMYDGEFMENPVVAQLQASIRLLVSPQKPMTLFFAYDRSVDADKPLTGTSMAQVLRGGIQSFLAQTASK